MGNNTRNEKYGRKEWNLFYPLFTFDPRNGDTKLAKSSRRILVTHASNLEGGGLLSP